MKTTPQFLLGSCVAWACAVAMACSSGDIREEGTSGTFPTGTSGSAETQGGGTDSGAASDGATSGGGSSGPVTSGGGNSTSGGGVQFDGGDGSTDATTGDGGDGGDDDACGCNSQSRHNYIWVSNSAESTVSKINTATIVEEGRYLTRPDGLGDPSRTSVTISGRAVAVANRRGGVTKFWSNLDNCIDRNANGQIDTSSGATDVLPWGEDECMAWHTPLDYFSNRPVAWTCHNNKEMLWTAGTGNGGIYPDAHILLLDGDTGAITQTVVAANFGGGSSYGPYGGAVDSAGNFWTTPMGGFTSDEPEFHRVHRVDAISFVHESFPMDIRAESYGITVDKSDNVWVTSFYTAFVGRFTPSTQTWDLIPAGASSQSGIAEGPDGRMWYGGRGLEYVDPATLVSTQFVSGGIGAVKGVAIDSGDFVWVVDYNSAFKIDATSGAFAATYDGLTGPYTYSDMTGWAVQNTAGCLPPPPG